MPRGEALETLAARNAGGRQGVNLKIMPTDSGPGRSGSRHSTETDLGGAPVASRRAPLVPGLTVLYHPDLGRIGERAVLLGLVEGGETLVSRREPSFGPPGGGGRRPLEHASISRQPIRLHREAAGAALHLDAGGTRSRVEADGEPLGGVRQFAAAALERGVVLRLGPHVVLLLHLLDPLSLPDLPQRGLIGESPEIVRVRLEIGKVGDLKVPVLLRGETGSGKELAARAIHDAGARRNKAFVAVNMAELPPALAAAELFGAVRGAYTGADRQRRGLFSQADGGTLFLDEIGETPAEVQALLLRVLETGEIRPLGSEEGRKVDVRLISATDADLEAAVAGGLFRAPLLHRLSGFDLRLPPLRTRRDDFGRLFLHFLRQEMEAVGEAFRLAGSSPSPWLPADQVARLAAYPWPGNVRQLLNVIRQIVATSRGEEHARLPEAVEMLLAGSRLAAAPTEPPAPPNETPPPVHRKPSLIGDDQLVELLRTHRFNLRAAAAAAGISPTSLYALVEKCPRLRKPAEIGRAELEESLARSGSDVDAAALALEVSSLGLKRRLSELGLR
jgi:two-component system nitrogen regulation response regulator GlnG